MRRVFDDDEIVRAGDGEDGIHVGGQAEEVDGHDGARPGRDGGFEQRGIDVVGDRVDVHKNGLGADVSDRASSRDETEGRGDDFISLADTGAQEGEDRGVGAGGAAYGEF